MLDCRSYQEPGSTSEEKSLWISQARHTRCLHLQTSWAVFLMSNQIGTLGSHNHSVYMIGTPPRSLLAELPQHSWESQVHHSQLALSNACSITSQRSLTGCDRVVLLANLGNHDYLGAEPKTSRRLNLVLFPLRSCSYCSVHCSPEMATSNQSFHKGFFFPPFSFSFSLRM